MKLMMPDGTWAETDEVRVAVDGVEVVCGDDERDVSLSFVLTHEGLVIDVLDAAPTRLGDEMLGGSCRTYHEVAQDLVDGAADAR